MSPVRLLENGGPGWAALFSTDPPIERRIAALQSRG